MKTFQRICFLIIIVGAIAWGIIGIFDINFISRIFGEGLITKIIYITVGIAGLLSIWFLIDDEKK